MMSLAPMKTDVDEAPFNGSHSAPVSDRGKTFCILCHYMSHRIAPSVAGCMLFTCADNGASFIKVGGEDEG